MDEVEGGAQPGGGGKGEREGKEVCKVGAFGAAPEGQAA